MNLENVKKELENCGAVLAHVGFLTYDNEKAVERLGQIPGFGEWVSDATDWSENDMIVGPPNSIKCSNGSLFGSVNVELVQPVRGKSAGTHFADYLEKSGEGLHHFCYKFQKYDDFKKAYDYMMNIGCKDVHHGKLDFGDDSEYAGQMLVEFCYVSVEPSGLYIELNWTNPNA